METRRNDQSPDLLLLHYTGMASAEKACEWLCVPQSKVSCHYLISEAGEIIQMVDEDLRAWHAGVSVWEGDTDINSRSIGIEIQNPGHTLGYPDFPPRQMDAVIALSRDIIERHAITPWHVLAHSDVAPGRKVDPGEKFDWRLLHLHGVGHWVEPVRLTDGTGTPPLLKGMKGEAVLALQQALASYGYGVACTGEFDGHTQKVVAAFQRHFRPQLVDGAADASTLATLAALLSGRPAVTGTI